MTKEEIVQAISDDKTIPFIQPKQLAQIVAFVVENYRPSLPSNLDEAAEEVMKWIGSEDGTYPGYEVKRGVKMAFKAGAEWNSPSYSAIKKVLALGFMHFLDENRPVNKMCLSNGEYTDIEKAFDERDWEKLERYLKKYSPMTR